MERPIFDLTRRRYISVDTAFERGFPSANFRIPANSVIFAIPDARRKRKARFELITDARAIANYRKTKRITQVYPIPQKQMTLELPLDTRTEYEGITGIDTTPMGRGNPYPRWHYQPFLLPLRMALEANISGKRFNLTLYNKTTGEVADSHDFDATGKTAEEWWQETGNFYYNVSDRILDSGYRNVIRWVEDSTHIAIRFYAQVAPTILTRAFDAMRFRDGERHCIMQPIIDYFQTLVNNAASQKTKQNRSSQLRKAQRYLTEFADGIPQDKLLEVAKGLDVTIVIEDVLFNELRRYNDKSKTKVFRYIFSRVDHAELTTINLADEPTTITPDVAIKMINDCYERREFCIYTGSITAPTSIIRTDGKYNVDTPLSKSMFEFTKTFDRGMFINSVKEPELAKFCIDASNIVINWRNNKKTPKNEIDMTQAYTQYRHAPHYVGFPSIITNFRKTEPDHDIKTNVGIYQILITRIARECSHRNGVNLLRAYGFKEDARYILTTPWLCQLKALNVSFNVEFGAWGKSFDFDFSPEIIDTKMYSIWTGLQLHTQDTINYKMHAHEDYARTLMTVMPDAKIEYAHTNPLMHNSKLNDFITDHRSVIDSEYFKWLKEQTPEDQALHRESPEHELQQRQRILHELLARTEMTFMRDTATTELEAYMLKQDAGTLMIRKPKDSHQILPHIAAFIVSYCQLNVFKESLKYDINDIIGTKLDSIVLACDIKDLNTDLFKDVKTSPKWSGIIKMNDQTSPFIFRPKQIDATHSTLPMTDYAPKVEGVSITGDMFISGQGGGGKTHMVLTNKGYRKVLFATTAWKLITEKINEYGVRGCSLNQLLGYGFGGKPIQSYLQRFGQPGLLVIDEMSMISAETIADIKRMYPHSQLLLLGDYAHGKYYQSRLHGPDFTPYHPPFYVTIHDDRRSKDEATRIFKSKCREIMKDGKFIDLLTHVFNSLAVYEPHQVKAEYDLDYIITGTHAEAERWTSLLQTETRNHYLVMSHSMTDVFNKIKDPSSAYLHGEIIDHPIEGRTKLTHGFTVHSFQGITVPIGKRCYVAVHSLHAMEDIYTAVSRVESISQLRIIP